MWERATGGRYISLQAHEQKSVSSRAFMMAPQAAPLESCQADIESPAGFALLKRRANPIALIGEKGKVLLTFFTAQ